MSAKNDSYRIVFLVDVECLLKCSGCCHTRRKCQEAHQRLVGLTTRSILLLLTYYSGRTLDQTKHLQWSYKLYNTESRKGCQNFKDFDLKSFEYLENDLRSVISAHRCQSVDGETTRGPGGIEEEAEEAPRCKLRRGLTEILHDFQWDRPDIMSPVKRRHSLRRRTSLGGPLGEDCGPRQLNLVFLFSGCPRTLGDALSFADCTDNGWLLLHAFLPKQVYQKFRQGLNISLFWVDVEATPNPSQVGNPPEWMNSPIYHLLFITYPVIFHDSENS